MPQSLEERDDPAPNVPYRSKNRENIER